MLLLVSWLISAPTQASEAVILAQEGMFRVNLTTGTRTLIASEIPEGNSFTFILRYEVSLGIAPSGDIFVNPGNFRNKIYRFFPGNHARQEVTDLNNSLQGPSGSLTSHLAITSTNHILLPSDQGVVSLDPSTGQRRLISDYLNPGQGISPNPNPQLITVDMFGRIVLNQIFNGSVSECIIPNLKSLVVDEISGNRTPAFARSADYCSLFGRPDAPDIPKGNILINNSISYKQIFTDLLGNAIRANDAGSFFLYHDHDDTYNPGFYTLISAGQNSAQGPVIRGKVVDFDQDKASNLIYFLEQASSVDLGGLYALDPNTGIRTRISDFNNSNQGSLIHDPVNIVVGVLPAYTGGTVPTPATPANPEQIPGLFSFKLKKNVSPRAMVVSNRAKINGIPAGSAPISVVNGQYAIMCKKFTATPGVVKNGQTACVRHRAAKKRKTATTTTLTVGGATAVFTSITK